MEYALTTDIAKFVIRSEPLGMWDLWVNEMPTLTFATPEDAAIAVFEQRTGFIGWDNLEKHDAPPGLEGWEQSS